MVYILTKREQEIIEKKLKGIRLTQTERNIMSKSIRPKLRAASMLDAPRLLQRLEYNQKGLALERKIKKFIEGRTEGLQTIILYGSAIQTNYAQYNDIDVLLVAKKKTWKTQKERFEMIRKLKREGQANGMRLDVGIIDYDTLLKEYPRNPGLIYQLKDSKIISGSIRLPVKFELSKLDLRMKLDWSDSDEDSSGKEIYQSLRNALLVKLAARCIIDNDRLRGEVALALGRELIEKLKKDTASADERKAVVTYIQKLVEVTNKEIREAP